MVSRYWESVKLPKCQRACLTRNLVNFGETFDVRLRLVLFDFGGEEKGREHQHSNAQTNTHRARARARERLMAQLSQSPAGAVQKRRCGGGWQARAGAAMTRADEAFLIDVLVGPRQLACALLVKCFAARGVATRDHISFG
eukprot:COSAG06_NODE_36608_length_445_cov_0.589595_1_plen_140_part_10